MCESDRPMGGATRRVRAQPDWPTIHRELRRKDVTLALLWEEYRAVHPDGYGYSRFCDLYRRWEGRLAPTMRQHHVAGERMFVDYAGATLAVIDPATGAVRLAQLFVAALGASNYLFAEATWTQTLPDWIGSHGRALAWFGGVPGQIVSDNLKAGVSKACFYEPAINRTYADMAAHYDTAVVPARPYRPRDKAKVEVAVQVAQRWIVARLRHRRFFSLAELNTAIRDLVDALNDRVTRHLGASRRQLFEDLEWPALKPLPAAPYVYAQWQERTVGLDYHVEVDRHHYSVPHRLLRQKVWARATEKTVEIFHDGQRVAAHLRSPPDRGLPHSPPARPGAVPAARHRHLDRGAPQSLDHRALRRRQDLARLRPRSEGLPEQPHRPLQAPAPPLRRARARPRRRPLSPPVP